MKAYRATRQQVIQNLNTNEIKGLTKTQVDERLKKYGYNALPEGKRESIFTIFLSQFKNPLIYILLIAAAIIFFLGQDRLDAFIISGVLFFNAIIGTIQEGRTYNIIESLKRFIKTNSIVLRDGTKEVVEDKLLVPGDIILLQEGERVPADARILESNNLQIDEAVLTGESKPIRKNVDAIDKDVVVGDRTNMLFRGTYVLSGSGKAVVVGTGTETQIGKIHATVEEIKTDIPLKKELERLSYFILIFILCACVVLFGIGLFIGKPVQELLIMLTALFICVVPEGLPVVLTLVLVTGAYKMAKQFVLIKNMQAVEALGRTDVIVIDKTGTLTRNEMAVSKVFADDKLYEVTGRGYYDEGDVYHERHINEINPQSNLYKMGIANSLLNTTEITFVPKLKLFDVKGSPTEAALYIFSKKLGLKKDELEQTYKKIYEIPFEANLKYHAGFYKINNQVVIFVTGSPEGIFERSRDVSAQDQSRLEEFLAEGLRVIAVGTRTVSLEELPLEGDEQEMLSSFKKMVNDLEFLGLCAIQDSIRPEVRKVIKEARDAGIRVIMATGDHKETALYVARKVDIFRPGDHVLTGPELHALSDEQLLRRLKRITVYARVSPEDKLRIVQLFHKQGNIVAMTGDGINDAPSLVAADLGIAMGSIGTEVAKQASDIVLLDDSFVNIMNAVREGRHIFYTLRRVILYFFATNMGEILIILFAFLVNPHLPLPLTAAQILWLNLVTDGFLDVALSMEPPEKGLLSSEWLKHKVRLVDWNLILKMLFMAVPMGLASLVVFWWYQDQSIGYARTMTLITMAMFQWFNAWNCRSETKSIFQLGLFTNKWLILATGFVLFLQGLIVYVPFMRHIFKTVPLSAHDWLVVFAVSSPIILLEEVRKWIVRHWLGHKHP